MDYFRAARDPAATRARATRTDESPSLLPPTRTQWVSTGLAIALLWGFVIAALADPVEMSAELRSWQTWVSRNTGWLFIAAFVRAPPSSLEPPVFLDPRIVTPSRRFFRLKRLARAEKYFSGKED
jgi:hypothetical protein